MAPELPKRSRRSSERHPKPRDRGQRWKPWEREYSRSLLGAGGRSAEIAFRVLEGIVAVIRDRAQDALEFSYNASAKLECTLESPRHAQVLRPIAPGDSDTKSLDDHDVTFASTALPNPRTGRQEISIVVHPANGTKEVLNGIWTLTFTETAGHQADVDGWIQPESAICSRFVGHPPDVMLIQLELRKPAIAKTVIAVGNFNPRPASSKTHRLSVCRLTDYARRRCETGPRRARSSHLRTAERCTYRGQVLGLLGRLLRVRVRNEPGRTARRRRRGSDVRTKQHVSWSKSERFSRFGAAAQPLDSFRHRASE